MNRRDFMGTVVGGIAVAKLGTAGLVGYGAEAVVRASNVSAGSGAARGMDRKWTDRCRRRP